MSTAASTTPPRGNDRLAFLVATIGSLLLLGTVWVPWDGEALPDLARFAGRLHPMVLHLPIGFLCAVVALELLARMRRSTNLDAACSVLLWLTVLFAIPAVIAGALLAAEGGYADDLLSRHRWLGAATAILAIWLLVLRPRSTPLYAGALFVNLVVLVGAGHFGASLTHGANYLTQYAPFLAQDSELTQGSGPSGEMDGDRFAHTVRPLFEQKCATCHGPEKRKAGLRLDTLAGLMKGSESGPVVFAGKPEASTLIEVLQLPIDDDRHMPPEGKPQLSAEEIAVVQGWVETLEPPREPVTAAVGNFHQVIQPLLQQYCFRCHGGEKPKGDLRLDTLDPDMVNGSDAEWWHAALDMINGGVMPPRKAPQMSDEERRTLVAWMTDGIKQAELARQGEGHTVMRRLTKAQYTNTLQDLLGVPIEFGEPLPDDGKSEMGFTNNGEVLLSSSLHLEYYQAIARQALDQAVFAGEKPEPTWYRATFGKGLGKGLVAGRTGGYQSVPLNPDDFTVEILDGSGQLERGVGEDERKALDRIRKRISIGLRGSSQDRFRLVDEGMLLFSALPHKEKVPKSWQGPSPNVKLEMQRCFPEAGDFVLRVRASRGYIPPMHEQLLLSLDDPRPIASLSETNEVQAPENARVFEAAKSDQRKNIKMDGDMLIPVEIPKPSWARFQVDFPRDGFYQFDLVHPVGSPDAMASVRLKVDGRHLDLRPEFDVEEPIPTRMVTALGAAGLRSGRHQVRVGGPFFVGFSHLVITPLAADHPLVVRLIAQSEQRTAALAERVPSMRAFVGTRTDDGMDYKTFGEPQEVHAALGHAETYTFVGRLENLPIPEPESGDDEILSGFMLLGLWNDHLVKTPAETGPPLLIESLEFEAPYFPVWPPESHTKIFFTSPHRDDQEAYTAEVLSRFMERAFRRPLLEGEVERYLDFWREVKADFARYEDGVREVLVAVLCSPNFLFLAEPQRAELADDGLSDGALATRLSYFLWNSPPDAVLRDLAAEGRLREALLDQVDRMLEDPRVWRFVRAFAYEWLRLDRHASMTINVDAHPKYTRFVKRDMAEETYHFLHHVLREDLSVFTLIDSDFAMLNQNLAEFYGLEGVEGAHFRPVSITPEQRRGGLLSQGAFLSGHSDGTRPHPIKRAVWIKEKILGDPPPPPPPNVPDLDPETPGFEKLTLKEQLEAHRDNPSCVDCHLGIDPYGVVFEPYSAVGLYEEKRRGRVVDARSTLPDGTPLDGVDELKAHLLSAERDAFTTAFIEHLFAYAMGRDVHLADQEEIARILVQVKVGGYRMRSVLRSLVTSPSFTQR